MDLPARRRRHELYRHLPRLSAHQRLDHRHRPYLARQRPLRRHLRRPHAKPPRPRRPLDLLLVAVEAESIYPDLNSWLNALGFGLFKVPLI